MQFYYKWSRCADVKSVHTKSALTLDEQNSQQNTPLTNQTKLLIQWVMLNRNNINIKYQDRLQHDRHKYSGIIKSYDCYYFKVLWSVVFAITTQDQKLRTPINFFPAETSICTTLFPLFSHFFMIFIIYVEYWII